EDAFAVTADKLRSAVVEHIEDEEQKAFVHLRDEADDDQAESLTRSVKQFRGALHYEMSK
ncbi:MAG: hypothetical protein WBA06_07445, partial [Candidatus Aquilonibacter sp.]